MLLNISFT